MKKRFMNDWVKICYLMLIAGFVLVPLLAAVLGGFKSLGELQSNPIGLPNNWEFEHYGAVLNNPFLWNSMKNSFVISSMTLILTLLGGAMTAFTFSHIRFVGHRYVYSYFLLGMMFPFATGILPLFIKIRDLGLLDSFYGVVIPQVAFGLAMAILLFKTFFEQLPAELFDAARVDGCGYARFFFEIVIPLSTPILATVGVFVLVTSWNNYLLPLVVLNNSDLYPWTLGIMQYQGEFAVEWNKVLAYVSITVLPALAFFIVAQKYIVAGLTGGAVKG
ncbi:carbohydrate ABC transporter permease [Alginatibacterium sediminis]|uniref:Carbohydrate ABC transporter permease n=1 Tax=Alginatibacterium sediminis TaxID=2164068 RepID=A0A420EGK3_9ALTE|nr:carbohydrate ABC transporter permease [Alginatibacterium sediminis]RKF19794.1 carbohydrate ABC transporter permease [Alginatibacterium sediminis]